MNRRVVVLVALVAVSASLACQDILEIGPVPAATDGDGGTDGASGTCDPYGAFASTDPIPSLSGPNVVSAMLSPDENTAFVCMFDTAAAQMSLHKLTRSGGNQFGDSNLLVDNACSASISADGTQLLYESDNSGVGDPNAFEIFQIESDAGALAAIGKATEAQPLGVANGPFVLPDGGAFYYRSTQGVSIGIHRGIYPSFANAKLNALPPGAADPVLTGDELVIYYSDPQLAVATRAAPSDDFSDIQHVVTTDASGESVRPVFVSADRCRVYFSRVTRTVSDAGTSYSTETFVGTRTP